MKKLLFVSYTSPFRTDSGAAYRMHWVLRWLSERCSVDVVYQCSEQRNGNATEIRSLNRIVPVQQSFRWTDRVGAAIGPLPYHHRLWSTPGMRLALENLLSETRYDCVWLNKSVHFPLIAPLAGQFRIVIDQLAAESSVWENLIKNDPRWHVRLFSRINRGRVLNYEKKVYQSVALAIAISPEDQTITEKVHPGTTVVLVPQGVDTETYVPDPTIRPTADTILFCGTGVTRNAEAVKRFVERIMPLVHQRHPQMRFLWIGNVNAKKMPFLQKPWIETTGHVESVVPHFGRGRIFVSPFTMGEGMKTKVVEAFAMEKVVVGTPMGTLGLLENTLPFLRVRDSDQDIALSICEFREHNELDELGKQARQHAVHTYSWRKVLAPLERFLSE